MAVTSIARRRFDAVIVGAGGAGMRGSFVNNFAAEGASLSASTGTGGGLAALPWYAWAALAAAAVFLFMVLKKKL